MEGDETDLELLVATAEAEIATFRADPRLGPTVGDRGSALREHVLDVLAAVEHRLTRRPASGAQPATREAFARTVRQSVLVLQGAQAALPWLAATRSPSVNLGSLYLTEECARILVGAGVDLVVVPNEEYMYSTVSWPFERIVLNTPGFSPNATRRPIVLNYPLSDSDRLLVHPIFMHELGHAGVDEHSLIGRVESGLLQDQQFVTALRAEIDAMVVRGDAPDPTEAMAIIRIVLFNWIEELLCDQLAAAVIGPPFLWSFAAFGLPRTYHEIDEEHPANTVRIKLVLDALDARGWKPFMTSVAPQVAAWLDEVASDSMAPTHDPLVVLLRDHLVRRADILKDAASAVVGPEAFEPADGAPQAADAAQLLAHLVLPVGLDSPLEIRAILLGGWQHAFVRHGDSPSGIVSALRDTSLQDLVGKAMELSTVARAWQQTT